MAKELHKKIETFISDLTANQNFSLYNESYYENVFGNEIIELRSENLKIRFVKDRGEIFIEISPTDLDVWINLDIILVLLGVYSDTQLYTYDILGHIMVNNIKQIEKLFKENDMKTIKNKLAIIEKDQIKKMFGNRV